MKSKKKKWLANVTRVFNRYIRLRDLIPAGSELLAKCISCGATWELVDSNDWKKWQAGHYWREDKYESVRFDERNVNGQCLRCNHPHYLSGNLAEYAEGLKEKIGTRAFNSLSVKRFEIKKYSILELEGLYRKYKKLVTEKEIELGL